MTLFCVLLQSNTRPITTCSCKIAHVLYLMKTRTHARPHHTAKDVRKRATATSMCHAHAPEQCVEARRPSDNSNLLYLIQLLIFSFFYIPNGLAIMCVRCRFNINVVNDYKMFMFILIYLLTHIRLLYCNSNTSTQLCVRTE